MYFYEARFYDPVLSRFTSADSLIPGAGNVQAWDRYAAMANNPVNRIDPTGHSSGAVMHDSYGDSECNDPYHCLDASGKLLKDGDPPPPYKPTSTPNPPIIPNFYTPVPQTYIGPASDISDDAIPENYLFGVNYGVNDLGGAAVGGGIEVVSFPDSTIAIFKYSGSGTAVGVGGNVSIYGGMAVGYNNPEDYTDRTRAGGFSASILKIGLTGGYFHTPDNSAGGVLIGYSPGARFTLYDMNYGHGSKTQEVRLTL